MIRTKRIFKRKWILPIVLVLSCIFSVSYTIEASENNTQTQEEGVITTADFSDLKGKTAGVLTGTPQDTFVMEKVEEPDLQYFNNVTDLALALQEGKIDYFVNSTISYQIMHESYPEFSYINSIFKSFDIGTIFSKDQHGEELKSQFNNYVKKIKSDGTLEQLQNEWLYPNDWKKVDIPNKGENGVLKVAAIATMKPFCFVIDDGYGGLDIAIVAGFAKENGYGVEIENVDFSGALSGISSGKYDLANGQISYTEERAEKVYYSSFYCSQDIVAIVRTKDYQEGKENNKKTFSLWESFKKTLLEQNRYRIILSGLATTMLITIFGFLLANIFGAVFCYLAMSKYRICKLFADIYSHIMQGTPMLVILMILYYIIFGNVKISGILVASLAFGITVGAYLAQLFQGAIQGVSKGQIEAAYAMGFSKYQAFIGIVLPQAIRKMLPGYFSQLISLMKQTSVVGYIAVSDLTRAGDIIRGATFEPFFPLIIVAIIYFSISSCLLIMLRIIQNKLMPRKEKGGNHS